MQTGHATLHQIMRTAAEFPPDVRFHEYGRMFQIEPDSYILKFRPRGRETAFYRSTDSLRARPLFELMFLYCLNISTRIMA